MLYTRYIYEFFDIDSLRKRQQTNLQDRIFCITVTRISTILASSGYFRILGWHGNTFVTISFITGFSFKHYTVFMHVKIKNTKDSILNRQTTKITRSAELSKQQEIY